MLRRTPPTPAANVTIHWVNLHQARQQRDELPPAERSRLSDPDLPLRFGLRSRTAWYLLATNGALNPFIFQRRKAPVFVSQTNMDSDDVFNKGKWKFGVEARGNSGYGLWQLAWGSTGI